MSRADDGIECLGGTPNTPIPEIDDCGTIVNIMRSGAKRNAPLHFSRTEGFMVPYCWAIASCLVDVDVMRP